MCCTRVESPVWIMSSCHYISGIHLRTNGCKLVVIICDLSLVLDLVSRLCSAVLGLLAFMLTPKVIPAEHHNGEEFYLNISKCRRLCRFIQAQQSMIFVIFEYTSPSDKWRTCSWMCCCYRRGA